MAMSCPIGGDCPAECDRTQNGCVSIWGPAAEHAEACRINAAVDGHLPLLGVNRVKPWVFFSDGADHDLP